MRRRYHATMKKLAVGSLIAMAVAQPAEALAVQAAAAGQPGVGVMAANAAETKLVPLRALAEAIGAKVEWEEANRQAIVSRGSAKLAVTIGERNAVVGGTTTLRMSVPAELTDERTMVPLEAVKRALQVDVDWDGVSGLAIDPQDVVTAGTHFVYLLQNGQFAAAHAMLNDKLKAAFPEALLAQYWAGNTAVYGAPAELKTLQQEKTAVHNNASLGYTTAQGAPFGIAVRFDASGRIDDLFLPLPAGSAYQPPEYDKPELYAEEEVVVGEGQWALPGTLTLPKGDGPFPAVVLVHGSGPNDRDESVGSYKTFRDLAIGLAARNIAVLRYEKRTREHTLGTAMTPGFTVKEETVDDALAAVRALRKDSRIDTKRIYVLGHSQGGMLVPRIIEADANKTVAGSIIMAGPSKPLEDIVLQQNRQALEWARQAGQPTDALEQQVQAMERQIALLKDPQYSAANVPAGFTLQNPAWWFDLRNYYGGDVAKHQAVPLLIMQGDNDFQVTADNLDGWKQALSARSDVAYKLYPKLNHGFVSFDGPSTGQEYALPGNVPDYVIADIAEWLGKQP